ncbi:MAG: TetR/AcrR family transcriptional regulator [Desulfobacteraceae bacterium]|nr:TetR/AcrR family transcriptional regulator [Desulfobacteraceae bacterium]MCF8036041.1 TetR/AcrR family transcriptional regulator [Desulfobacteraceae bacterium]
MAPKTFEDLKSEERETRKKLIAETTRNLFARNAFREVTIRKIAQTTGVSVGTIYNHYSNIDELFLEVFLENGRQIIRLVGKALGGDSSGALSRVGRVYVNYLNENMTFFQMMSRFVLEGELNTADLPKLNQTMRELLDLFEEAIRIAGSRTNTRLSAHAFFSALNGVMISYAKYPGRAAEESREHTLRLADIIAENFELQKYPIPVKGD